MTTFDGDYSVYAYFSEFFDYPFHAVDVFSGGDGYCYVTSPHRKHREALDNLDRCVTGLVVKKAASVTHSLSVNHLDGIAYACAQHFDAVLCLALGQGKGFVYVGSIELNHCITLLRACI